ncbi:uncharacterized protein LOC141685529 [Apium graveolens]|uniref:uncharacterized protein LOC141685529 n=1 Tax=Apium graveolens TaxID=4045 RepID=UPI003D7C0CE8
MGAHSLASSNAYFQGAVRQSESWKRASDKADNALRKQQRKYASLERKLKRKEEELEESNAELVVLRAEKDKVIDNYLDSEEFTQSMRVRDDSVFSGFFRTSWDTTLGTVNEACPDTNPANYVCPDDEALLQRFRTRVVVSDRTPQDPHLPPPESSSRPFADDSSSSFGTTETSSETAKEINEDTVPPIEETARMKKAQLAGLDTREKATEPIFLRKHKEPMGEASAEGAEGHSAPITAAVDVAAAIGVFQPLWV